MIKINKCIYMKISGDSSKVIKYLVMDIFNNLDIEFLAFKSFHTEIHFKIASIDNELRSILFDVLKKQKRFEVVEEISVIEYGNIGLFSSRFIDAIAIGIVVVNNNNEIDIINSACENIIRVKKIDIIGRNINDFTEFPPLLLKKLETGYEFQNIMFSAYNSTGPFRYLACGRPIINITGKKGGYVILLLGINLVREMTSLIVVPEK